MGHPLQSLLDTVLDGRTKGYPQDGPPLRLSEVGAQGWSLLEGGTGMPAAVLRRSALDGNAAWMRGFLARSGASLCPHGKTTMAPQLFHRQLADGAWGITLATVQQARVAYECGVRRILLANEPVAPGDLAWIRATLEEDWGFELLCLADTLEGVTRLAAPGACRRPLKVLVELGIPGGRTGARDGEAALAVARAVRAEPSLALAGVECYEGIVATRDPDEDARRIASWLKDLGRLARACDREGLFETPEVILSAGGSAYFDLVAAALGEVRLGRPARVVLRSGCYLSHDAGHYQHLVGLLEARLPEAWRQPSSLEPALEVWGRVVSRPEPGLAFLDVGKRDVSHDLGLPRPIRWFRPGLHDLPQAAPEAWRISLLYDQHARLEAGGEEAPAPGDLVACAISHPCTTFDKWRLIYVVDDAYRVVDALLTCF
jgi:D-serine dehydratase